MREGGIEEGVAHPRETVGEIMCGDAEDSYLVLDYSSIGMYRRFLRCVLQHIQATDVDQHVRSEPSLELPNDLAHPIFETYGASFRTLYGLRRFYEPVRTSSGLASSVPSPSPEEFDDIVLCYVHWHRHFRSKDWSFRMYELTGSSFLPWKGKLLRYTGKNLKRVR